MRQGWIKNKFGDLHHFVDDEYHNDDGPPIHFSNGSKAWYKHGKRHRENGPGFERYMRTNNDRYEAWYYNGKYFGSTNDGMTNDKFIARIKFIAFM